MDDFSINVGFVQGKEVLKNGKWEVASGKLRVCDCIVKMPDTSCQMPECFARSNKLKLCDSLFLFFDCKKEGGPT